MIGLADITSLTCSGPGGTRAAALPHDAACEEINPDVGLSFLDGFVANAEAHGAAPYMPYELRSELGAVRMPRRADEDDDLHKLHFEAYQKPVAPSPVAAQHAVVFPDGEGYSALVLPFLVLRGNLMCELVPRVALRRCIWARGEGGKGEGEFFVSTALTTSPIWASEKEG